jgi:hypothetical protein
MRRLLVLGCVAASSVFLLAFGVGSAAAGPQPGGCQAFGAFMGVSAPWSGQNQRPLGQEVRQQTPFSDALAVFKTHFCS